jgi:hypothetical protein
MKKYTFILAIGAVFALMSCGSGSTTSETTDSTSVNLDSTAVTATDSTTAQITPGGGSNATSTEDGLKKPLVEEVK